MRKILSIDGGGIRGVFPAAFLANLEEDLEYPIGRYFDLIAGTSTGGIIAIGLALGMKASDLADLYEKNGPAIFSQTKSGARGWIEEKCRNAKWLAWGPKHSSDELKRVLDSALGSARIGDAQTRLFVPAWHRNTQSVYIFKTAHHKRLKSDYKELAVDAALATAAAPTYFEEHVTNSGVGLLDGGVWANNPTGLAVVEAVGVLDWPAAEIKVLSIGCLDDVRVIPKAGGVLKLCRQISGLYTDGQSHGSMGTAHILTGDPHQRKAIYRISQPVPDGFYSLDNTKLILDFKDRAYAEARTQQPILSPVFFCEPAEKFEPLYRSER